MATGSDGGGASLSVTMDRSRDQLRLRVAGEIDLATADHFENALTRAVTCRPPVIVVDLADVSFLDASGVHALVQADRRAAAAHRRLIVTRPQPLVRRVLDMTGVLARLSPRR